MKMHGGEAGSIQVLVNWGDSIIDTQAYFHYAPADRTYGFPALLAGIMPDPDKKNAVNVAGVFSNMRMINAGRFVNMLLRDQHG
jgi:hypothetical protein